MCLTLVRTGYLNVKSCYHYQNTSTSLGQRKLGRNVPVGADVKKSLNFDCPEEFGYYPHPADCTQYYVCVFGGALLESCTGGLMYSHELQTCDWPRNVGCDGTGDVVTTPSVAYVSSTPSRSADSKIRYSHPPPPPPIPPQPAAVVTSRGQPRQLQHSQQELIKQKQQQQLYVDADDTLSPAEEIESDRQQRVYRGQPSTVGQVQRDRDGLRQHTNAIPLSSGRGEKISIISFSGQQQQQPIQQYRIENKGNRAIEQTLSTVPPKTIYNNSNNYDSSRYDSYYALYDDDVDIYKDVEYAQHYNNEPTPKQVYRGTPATVTHEVIQQEKSPKISNSGYIQNTYSASDDIYQPADVQSYSDDVSYGTQDDERTVYHQTSKQTNRYPNTANQNEVRVQPTLYTLPGSPGSKHTPSIQKPTFPLLRTTPDASVQRPIIKQPSPFSFANHVTTPKTLFFHYITKTSMSTSIVSTTPTSSTPENYNKSQLNTTSSKIIIPTTYSPPFFFLKSRLNSHSGETVKKNNSWNSTDKSVPSFSNSSAHLEVNATSINNELWSSTNVATEENDEETATVPVAPAFQPQNNLNDKIISSSTESFKRTVYVPTTTTTTEFEPQEVSTSESVALDNDITNTSWLLLLERLNSITTENKTESTPISESENNQTSSYSFKSNLEKQLPFTSIPPVEVTKKLSSSRNTSLPARVSRVNTAIKSVIAFGGTPRQYKCSDSPNVTCGKINQRVTNNRGRGSAHYTTSGRNDNSVNRGTPPSRSRPTLKPSTSVVAKAAEFIDIYKYPPRRPEPIYPQPLPDKTAAKCRKDVCLLPDCSCGGKEIPGDLPVEQVPQMVLLTYDDSVNDLNKGLYSDLFEKGRVNPNGCPIAATFYVSHEWTDYSQVQNLYSDGHEIASHTVSHSFGEQFSQKKWTKEVAGQREILSAYGGVHLEDVRGMRAPFLSVGGNKMFKMLYDSNFTFDSSMPIYENKPPSWPYTLDYKLFHDCMIPPCPTRSYPGVWEVPMVMWQDLNGGRCSMGDACSNPSDAEGVYKMIMKNFERHYTSNRAPFGLFYHAAWFTQPHHKEGFIQFLDAINSMKDVWLVTNWQAIQWVRDPTPTSRLNSFQPFGCNYPDRPKRCNNPKVCNLWHKTGVRYMRTCQPCPDIYPWTGNTGIHSSRIDNDLEE
ncbi:uncharacterized protein LOC116166626 isoform X7 [Photinus pyralis]|uniref:uncharacterized protein LOC116166626 isoform X7 n=1 Tax=Photinus pyralis TaxID=7054 RepID=UPI001267588C|nr:uncharacterized protein LOC116166626 isoform X7 [Photinus pyralis]